MKNSGIAVTVAMSYVIGMMIVGALTKKKNNEIKEQEEEILKNVDEMAEGMVKNFNEEILTKTDGRIKEAFKQMKTMELKENW